MGYGIFYAAGALAALIVYVLSYIATARKNIVGAPALADITTLAVTAVVGFPDALGFLTLPHPVITIPGAWGAAFIGSFFAWLGLSVFTLLLFVLEVDISIEAARIQRRAH